MVPILTLLFVVAISILITKTATLALVHTGMARERARFQARSAFSGAGFTTSESEVVVKHPVRRRIITGLILLGNAGVVTAVSSLILGFVDPGEKVSATQNLYLLVVGIGLLYLSTRSKRLDRILERIIDRLLSDFTDIRPKSFSKIITVMEDFEVTELDVAENEWIKSRSLADLKLPDEGILVLGIIREDNSYVGVPRGRYQVESGDRLVIYGKADQIARLSKRHDKLRGKHEHEESVAKNKATLRKQDTEIENEP